MCLLTCHLYSLNHYQNNDLDELNGKLGTKALMGNIRVQQNWTDRASFWTIVAPPIINTVLKQYTETASLITMGNLIFNILLKDSSSNVDITWVSGII